MRMCTGKLKSCRGRLSSRGARSQRSIAIRRPLHGGQRLLMLGIYSGKEQHRFSAASNGKGSAPCARRIGLILELLSLLVFCVKLLLNVLAQRSEFLPLIAQLPLTPILAKGLERPSARRAGSKIGHNSSCADCDQQFCSRRTLVKQTVATDTCRKHYGLGSLFMSFKEEVSAKSG